MDWPGNVRELENTIERLYVLSPSKTIEGGSLLDEQSQLHSMAAIQSQPGIASAISPMTSLNTASAELNSDDPIAQLVGLPLDEIERRHILSTLEHCKGNKSKAARLLQIGLKTLYRKLDSYGMNSKKS